ncbi:ElaA protein [Curtobacterium luteum]|uniref:ElaA protein n=2 Tax=Curtobacterium luteum TaxID=33881 RepID=A0A8H9L0S4_9MICO|nr:ElaA protein [Curtobacterium luteum]
MFLLLLSPLWTATFSKLAPMSEHSVHRARWGRLTTDELYGIVVLRNRVFALEQRVTAEDFDGRDRHADTEHWWFGTDTRAVGYLRLVRPAPGEPHPDGAVPPAWVIGRVATDPAHRGRGIAGRLVAAVLDEHGDEPFVLHAQEYVAGLYERHGFVRFGEPYEEAGIRHVGMHRP